MPNVGWGELLLILLVALLVFGPKRLPEMMRSLGQAVRAFQEESSRAADSLRMSVEAPAASSNDHGVIDRPDGVAPLDAAPSAAPVPPPASPDPAALPPSSPEYHEDT
jgi:sec-independent protein translocase protein TatA